MDFLSLFSNKPKSIRRKEKPKYELQSQVRNKKTQNNSSKTEPQIGLEIVPIPGSKK